MPNRVIEPARDTTAELARLAALGRAADDHWEATKAAQQPAADCERARLAMRACWTAVDAEYARLVRSA